MKRNHFPTKSTLWRGCILGGIVNAVMASGFTLHRAWLRNSYFICGGDGRDGIITFAGGHWYSKGPLVGLFHDIHSKLYSNQDELPLERFFNGCPKYQRSLANQEALEYLKVRYDRKMLHRVTAAFWDSGNQLKSRDSWKLMLDNGVSLVRIEAIENIKSALAQWEQEWEMSDDQLAFAKSLFERKIAQPPVTIELSADEVRQLKKLVRDKESFKGCLKLLWEMGITAPTISSRGRPPT